MATLIRYRNPENALSSILDNIFKTGSDDNVSRYVPCEKWPKVDIFENKTSYTLKADLPGFDKNDIRISIDNDVLQIEGDHKEDYKREDGMYYHFERNTGKFRRSFALPENINTEKVEANMKNGVLHLTLPKLEKSLPKAIEVKVL